MLPRPDDAYVMEQSTLNQIFALFGKGVTQILQQVVNQQIVVDELRLQNRSLQTQVANLTAALDEVEDRIFVRLQNMQPTSFTREGIPIDDAVDTLAGKLPSLHERLTNACDAVSKVDAEVNSKVDREEFAAVVSDTRRMAEGFSDIANSITTFQKDVQKLRQEAGVSQDRLLQAVRLQVQSEALKTDMEHAERDLSIYATRDELNAVLVQLRTPGGGSCAGIDLAVSGAGDGPEAAFELEAHSAQQDGQIADEMARRADLPERAAPEEEEDEEDSAPPPPAEAPRELVDRWAGTNDDFGCSDPVSRRPALRERRRTIRLPTRVAGGEEEEDAAAVEEAPRPRAAPSAKTRIA
jgi:predicted  nucleic acid-binding Zn-ribbon protein